MVNYNRVKIAQLIQNFCKFPVPRTPIEIVRYLKMNNMDFYQKTPAKQVVKFLHPLLDELVEQRILVEYNEKSEDWEKARKLVAYYYLRNNNPCPRKLKRLYQINFFLIAREKSGAYLCEAPCFPEINLGACAMMYNFTKEREIPNFFLNLLNLMYCYTDEKNRHSIMLEIHSLGFEEREIEMLEKILENSITDNMQIFYNKLPFKPDLQKALTFLTLL